MKLIDKSALVAEIERLLNEPAPSHDSQCNWEDGYWCALYKIEEFINIIEVKEVDLEKEIQDIFQKYKNGYNGLIICNKIDFSLIAKHFFELGLKVQKGEKI